MANKGLRISIDLEKANAINQIINTDALGSPYYVNPPTVTNQVLKYNGTTLIWDLLAGTDNYIGNVGTHTAGGNLNMNNLDILGLFDLSFADQGGNLLGWTVRDGSTGLGDPFDDAFTITTSTFYTGFKSNLQFFNTEYGIGTFASAADAYTLTVDASGNVLENKRIPEIMLPEVAFDTPASKFKILPCNTTGGNIIVAPPGTPTTGDSFAIINSRGANLVVIDFVSAGQPFRAATISDAINAAGPFRRYHYVNATVGWINEY